MANTREIQSRMKSIQDTMKITNAMYMISSTKLRKAKKNLEETEPYFYTLQTMVSRIVRHLPEIDNKYFDERKDKPAEEKTTGLVVVTADKGLAGAYNHNVLKMAEEQMQKAGKTGKYKLFVVGELGRQYFGHRGIEVAEQFHYTAQNPTLHRARIITETILEQFEEEQLDEVYQYGKQRDNGTTYDASVTYHKRTFYYQRRTGSEYVSGTVSHDTVSQGSAKQHCPGFRHGICLRCTGRIVLQ